MTIKPEQNVVWPAACIQIKILRICNISVLFSVKLEIKLPISYLLAEAEHTCSVRFKVYKKQHKKQSEYFVNFLEIDN